MRHHFISILLYFLLCLAVTYPVILDPMHTLIGDSHSDIWAHIWGNWRTERDLTQHFRIPYEESFINYPFGGDLYHVDLLNSILSIPLRMLFGPILAQNILVWMQLSFGGYAMYLLGLHLQFSKWTSWMVGLIYAFCPFVLTLGLASGVTERLNLMWIPLYVLCFLNVIEERQWTWILGAVGCYIFATLGCWHYGLFLFLWSIPWTFFALSSTDLSKIPIKIFEIGLKRLLPLAILCAIFSIPLSRKASKSVGGESAIFDRSFDLFWDGVSNIHVINQAKLTDFFAPFTMGLWVTKNYDLLYETIYIGLFTIFFALLSLFGRRCYPWMFFLCSILFFAMSLGPDIRLYPGSEVFSSLLFYTIARYIPFIEAMEVPWEYSFMGIFCLAISAGYGIEFVLKNLPSTKWKSIIKTEVMILFFLETFWIAPVIAPIPSTNVILPEIYIKIAEQDGGAVFDFPPRRPYTALFPGEYFFYQSIHQRPIPHAIDETWLDQDSFWIHLSQHQQSVSNQTSLMTMFGHCWEGMPGGCNVLKKVQKKLRKHGYEYVILHKTKIPSQRWNDTVELFDTMLLEVSTVEEDSLLRIYQLKSL